MSSSTSPRGSHDRRRLAALWSGVLAGPLVFLVLLEVNYALSYVACETRQTWFLHGAAAVAALLVGIAGALAWRARIDDPLTPDGPSAPLSAETGVQRVRMMTYGAVLISSFFVLLILTLQIPVLVLRVCD